MSVSKDRLGSPNLEGVYPVSRGVVNPRLNSFIKQTANVRSLAEASQFPYREDVQMTGGFMPTILIEVDASTHIIVHAASEEYLNLFMDRFPNEKRTRTPRLSGR